MKLKYGQLTFCIQSGLKDVDLSIIKEFKGNKKLKFEGLEN